MNNDQSHQHCFYACNFLAQEGKWSFFKLDDNILYAAFFPVKKSHKELMSPANVSSIVDLKYNGSLSKLLNFDSKHFAHLFINSDQGSDDSSLLECLVTRWIHQKCLIETSLVKLIARTTVLADNLHEISDAFSIHMLYAKCIDLTQKYALGTSFLLLVKEEIVHGVNAAVNHMTRKALRVRLVSQTDLSHGERLWVWGEKMIDLCDGTILLHKYTILCTDGVKSFENCDESQTTEYWMTKVSGIALNVRNSIFERLKSEHLPPPFSLIKASNMQQTFLWKCLRYPCYPMVLPSCEEHPKRHSKIAVFK